MSPTVEALARTEPASRGFAVRLARTERLSESFLRLTFTGDDLDQFATTTLDQRIKFVLPAACGTPVDPALFDAPDWYGTWRGLSDDERPTLRTYTVRAVRPEAKEIDVDVVLHGIAPGAPAAADCPLRSLHACVCADAVGPAVRWCATASAGDGLVIIGPNARFEGPQSGLEWHPPSGAHTYLIAGDETAVPAMSSIIESLPAGVRAHVFLEVPTAQDVLALDVPEGVEVEWLPRRGEATTAAHGTLLDLAVRAGAATIAARQHAARDGAEPEDVDIDTTILWDVPAESSAPEGVYAWIAGEAGVVKELRRFLVRDLGLDRSAVAFMGYWRTGRSEG
ncbi:MAG: siderophore-interacting protein [Actinomycetales bacterium]|nr:siderophore-interacting protein [Actinomycetales bacterium]